MSTEIIAAFVVIGYIIITAVIMGFADRKQSDIGVFIAFAFLLPIFLIVLACFAVGYFPYKIAKDSFKRKEE